MSRTELAPVSTGHPAWLGGLGDILKHVHMSDDFVCDHLANIKAGAPTLFSVGPKYHSSAKKASIDNVHSVEWQRCNGQ